MTWTWDVCWRQAGLAELLDEVGGQLDEEQRAALPSAMGRFVIGDLRGAAAG